MFPVHRWLQRATPRATRGRAIGPRLAALSAALLAVVTTPAAVGAQEAVRSFLETRTQGVVLQEFDLSCGAAALATLLRYQHGDAVSERDIALGLISREEYLADPTLIQRRHGFSLLDLKRYVEARGYRGVGLGGLSMDSLIARAPMMVPIETMGYRHFVIFRGLAGNRVLLADPAFGNRTMLVSTFENSWLEAGPMGRVGFLVARADGLAPPDRLGARSDDFVMLR